MLNFLYQTMSHLWFGLAVFLIIFFICSRTAFFQTTLFQQNYSLKNKLHIIAFFSLLGILNTYWSLYGESWLINTSSIFIIVAGLVSGPLIGFCTSLLIHLCSLCFVYPYQSCSRERLLFPSRRATGRTFITLVQTKKRTAASRYRRKFYFRFQPYHFTRLILLSPHIYTIN